MLASCWTSVHSYWSQTTSGEWKKYISTTKLLFASQISCAIHTSLCSPNPFSVSPNAVFLDWALWTLLANEHEQNSESHYHLWTIRPSLRQFHWSKVSELRTFEEILNHICAKVQDHQNFPLIKTYGLTDGSKSDLTELKTVNLQKYSSTTGLFSLLCISFPVRSFSAPKDFASRCFLLLTINYGVPYQDRKKGKKDTLQS